MDLQNDYMIITKAFDDLKIQAHRARKLSDDKFVQVGASAILHDGSMIIAWNNYRKMENNMTREERRPFVVHAEQTLTCAAFMQQQPIRSVYMAKLLPCPDCMRLLALAYCKELFYEEAYDRDLPALKVAEYYGIKAHHVSESGIIRA